MALKKIIGKYVSLCSSIHRDMRIPADIIKQSASYSSTAGALPTPITQYASHGTGSDSGTEPHNAASPQSVSDSVPTSNYATGMAAPVYSSQPDQCTSLTAAPDLRSVMSAAGQPYTSVGAYSYPAVCQPHNAHAVMAPAPRSAWGLQNMGTPSHSNAAPANACYSYMDSVYPLHDAAPGP